MLQSRKVVILRNFTFCNEKNNGTIRIRDDHNSMDDVPHLYPFFHVLEKYDCMPLRCIIYALFLLYGVFIFVLLTYLVLRPFGIVLQAFLLDFSDFAKTVNHDLSFSKDKMAPFDLILEFSLNLFEFILHLQ
jgi:hypothetical protein